jgi:tetratricopeptide (TPR) repeat protein
MNQLNQEDSLIKMLQARPIGSLSATAKDERYAGVFEEAVKFQLAEQYKEAVERYSYAVEIDPAMFESYFNMALCFERLGNWQAALSSFENAVAKNRFSKAAFAHLVVLSRHLGMREKMESFEMYYNML